MRRTRELKQELEVPHEGASEVFFKYQEVSRARSGDLLAETIDESLSLDIEPLESAARLAHFTEQVHPDGTMTFDYRLRPGLATSTNALRLMQLIGIPAK